MRKKRKLTETRLVQVASKLPKNIIITPVDVGKMLHTNPENAHKILDQIATSGRGTILVDINNGHIAKYIVYPRKQWYYPGPHHVKATCS